ncbi:L,D-transpeptidase [Amphritea balenae]|uniref:L,D-transpeptidase n=1 Tax=Amphritea balenae TaxID=452629 RepID=A0A3P1STV2_9GAMM|nr:L,D-transpeptidase [Amphritea balenae]RRD00647.1 L,D-transpeptidase [Amphritea balenae]GGK69038.1 L,D-transpeptidase [Amphritea balenae]
MLLRVSLARQSLELWQGEDRLVSYSVSTALNGVGEKKNSGQTPRGWHLIRAKIGADQPLNAVFVGRRPTGEIYNAALSQQFPDRDWILTRILWLSGCETGFNRLGDVDTMQRYIYIHGTPDTEPMGKPLSHGCIRMRNTDIADLFERVSVGTPIHIEE